MKTLKRFSAVVSAAALLAVAFTGCNNSFAGTELNYAEKESEKVGTTGDLQNLSSATIGVTKTTTANKASERTTFTVTITNGDDAGTGNGTNTRVDLASAKNAINFYPLENNGTNYAKRGAALPKTLFSESETNKTAKFEFEVNTTSIPTSDVAILVDATKLKDKQGTLILNLDGNDKRGEETDNYITSITVDTTKTAVTSALEDFKPAWNPLYTPDLYEVRDSSNKLTGEYEVRISPRAYSHGSATEAPKVNKELAADLNSALTLRIRKPGSTSTETKSLSFSFDDDSTRQYYKASVGTLEPGTYYDIVITKKDLSAKAPAWYVEKYGHKAFIRDDAFGSKTATTGGNAYLYKTSPDYIVDQFGTTSVAWNEVRSISDAAIASAQGSYLSASRNGRVFTVTVTNASSMTYPIKLASYKDFKVIDTNDGVEYELPITYRVKYNEGDTDAIKDRVARIEIEVTNKNIAFANNGNNVKLYVGPGVVLEQNYVNSTQKKFGKYKDAKDGIHSGYVALTLN